MKRSRIAATTILIVVILSASVIARWWIDEHTVHTKTEREPPPPSSGGMYILDITGYRENSYDSVSGITCVTFLATVYSGNNGIDISKLRVHWMGPTQNVVLSLNKSSPTVVSATEFACDEVPVKTPRADSWNPGSKPPTFFLAEGNVIYIKMDLTPLNGINDPLGAGKTAQVYFEGVPGLPAYESFTTPFTYGTSKAIDLTML